MNEKLNDLVGEVVSIDRDGNDWPLFIGRVTKEWNCYYVNGLHPDQVYRIDIYKIDRIDGHSIVVK